MDVEPTVCLSPADIDVVCVAPKKKARALSHIWTDEETGVFLSLMQGDETTIGYLRCPETLFISHENANFSFFSL